MLLVTATVAPPGAVISIELPSTTLISPVIAKTGAPTVNVILLDNTLPTLAEITKVPAAAGVYSKTLPV